MDESESLRATYLRRQVRTVWQLVGWLSCAMLVAIFAAQFHGWLGALGISGIVALCAFVVGGTIGFLFAIPRVLSQEPPLRSSAAELGEAGTTPAIGLLGSNTNLEKVSDWLTTMLVGVGLSQLHSLDESLFRFRMFIEQTSKVFCIKGQASAGILPAIAPMLLVFGVLLGFLCIYLYTRLKLTPSFDQLERDLKSVQPVGQYAAKEVRSLADSLKSGSENPAMQSLAVGTTPSLEDALNVMYELLYKPGGYQQVINLGGTLATGPAKNTAEYWFYLAAAFGQKHAALKAGDTTPDALQSARDNAMDCARRCVELDASFKRQLWRISDPAGADDDLADFREDVTFRTLVGVEHQPTSRGSS